MNTYAAIDASSGLKGRVGIRRRHSHEMVGPSDDYAVSKYQHARIQRLKSFLCPLVIVG